MRFEKTAINFARMVTASILSRYLRYDYSLHISCRSERSVRRNRSCAKAGIMEISVIRTTANTFGCLALILMAGNAASADVSTERPRTSKWEYVGEWRTVSVENYVDYASFIPLGAMIRFDAATGDVNAAGIRKEFKLRCYSDVTPKQIDWTTREMGVEVMHRGIYRFRNGKLEMCFADEDGPRPSQFQLIDVDRRNGGGAILLRLERLDDGDGNRK